MPLRVYRLGPLLPDGGSIFVCAGAPANTGISWTLTGFGTLTPIGTKTSPAGVAIARYQSDHAGHPLGGYDVTVAVDVWP